MRFAKRFAGAKHCWICDTNPLGPLPWRQDILPAPGHQVNTESWMSCQWLRPSSLKLQGSQTSRHPLWRGLRSEAALIPLKWTWNVGGIISGETVLKRILVKVSWEPSWNRVGINSGETVLESWHNSMWTQHLSGLQTKLWISLVACAESENLKHTPRTSSLLKSQDWWTSHADFMANATSTMFA